VRRKVETVLQAAIDFFLKINENNITHDKCCARRSHLRERSVLIIFEKKKPCTPPCLYQIFYSFSKSRL
jgi:hypothetical protein